VPKSLPHLHHKFLITSSYHWYGMLLLDLFLWSPPPIVDKSCFSSFICFYYRLKFLLEYFLRGYKFMKINFKNFNCHQIIKIFFWERVDFSAQEMCI
jgi:hypothetical protein